MVDQLGNITTLAWNSAGYLAAAIDAQGNRTSYSYNGFGQVASIVEPARADHHAGL